MSGMDLNKLIKLIAENPQLWDHGNEHFRNQHLKNTTWETMAHTMGTTVLACKEAFKGLREKYLRERSKQMQQNEHYKKWELLDSLAFLEPHIISRRQTGDYNNTAELNCFDHEWSNDTRNSDSNSFTRDLITLVYNCRPLWDKENKLNYDKATKMQLWKTVARNLHTEANTCILKWKGLREKYIRQKAKYSTGKDKWEFLDALSFLDSVIQYRRKHYNSDDSHVYDQLSSDCDILDAQGDPAANSQQEHIEYATADVKAEFFPQQAHEHYFRNCMPDSTLDASSRQESFRNRTDSDTNEIPIKRAKRGDSPTKSPEQIFGELVSAILATKPEAEKNSIMLQVMQILTKNN